MTDENPRINDAAALAISTAVASYSEKTPNWIEKDAAAQSLLTQVEKLAELAKLANNNKGDKPWHELFREMVSDPTDSQGKALKNSPQNLKKKWNLSGDASQSIQDARVKFGSARDHLAETIANDLIRDGAFCKVCADGKFENPTVRYMLAYKAAQQLIKTAIKAHEKLPSEVADKADPLPKIRRGESFDRYRARNHPASQLRNIDFGEFIWREHIDHDRIRVHGGRERAGEKLEQKILRQETLKLELKEQRLGVKSGGAPPLLKPR
jgi:hypothetical protein